jgi:quercetin dioxygenase-like cupin family protein
MHIVNTNEAPKESIVGPLFTGSVWAQPLAPEGGDFNCRVVGFGEGVRNKFHAHDYEQVLIVTAGEGIIATEEREVVITPGDVVLIPANEKHWHGATEDSEFSHIYISNPASQITQLEE